MSKLRWVAALLLVAAVVPWQSEVAEAEQARDGHQSHPTWPGNRRPKPGVPSYQVGRVWDRGHSHQA